MAKKCSRCGYKVGFFEVKGWDIDEEGLKRLLCVKCLEQARVKFDPYRLSKGYTRINVTSMPECGDLPFPFICVVCGVPAYQFCDSKNVFLFDSMNTENQDYSVTESLSITVNICQRCTSLRLKVKDFFRVRCSVGGVGVSSFIFEVGNPEVSEILVKSIKSLRSYSGTIFFVNSTKLIKPGSKDWHPA